MTNPFAAESLFFAVTTERTLKVITELPVKGACRALGAINGNIVAALVKTVPPLSLPSPFFPHA